MADHSFFFAESVKLVIECKSQWELEYLKKFMNTCRAIHENRPRKSLSVQDQIELLMRQLSEFQKGFEGAKLISHFDSDGKVEDRISHIEYIIKNLLENAQILNERIYRSKPIGTVAIFLKGGLQACEKDLPLPIKNQALIPKQDRWFIDEGFPDLMLFLEAGVVTVKETIFSNDSLSNSEERKGVLKFIKYSDKSDGLLIFTKHLLKLLSDRSVETEGGFYFDDYISKELLEKEPDFEHCFELSDN
jgi:hypothetical protein